MLARARRTCRGFRSIGGIGGENIVEPGEPGDRPRAMALRQRRERRVKLRTKAEMTRDMSQVDDLATGRKCSQ